MPSLLQHVHGLIKAVGVVSALNILARHTAWLARPTALRLRDASRNKVMVRPTESDLLAAAQVFGWEDYRLSDRIIEHLNDVTGAPPTTFPSSSMGGGNVGYSQVMESSHVCRC
jgi:hypothetical protein